MGFLQRIKSGFLSRFANSAPSTFASPSADLIHALVGIPTAAGKVVTRETALRVAAFLGGVKMLSNDLAKMPLVLRETKKVAGRWRTQPALDEALYPLLLYCPNAYQTSYQTRWFLASQLIMNGNCYCQKITDQAGDVIALIPLNAWHTHPWWDRSTNPPTLTFRFNDGYSGGMREFKQSEIWHASANNLEGFGLEGSPLTILAKEALSLLMAAEEVAGRNFANGLGMGGFISFPDKDQSPTEPEAQNIVDRLRRDFAGSQNAGKFSIIPGGGTWVKMTFNAQESQLLESRQWSEQEVVRLLGGAPLLVKMGLGEKNSTYASSSAFLDEYFNTSLLPYTTAIEQSITRDLVPQKKWGRLYAKHSADVILRGSPKERAETNAILINSWQMTPNEGRAIEDRDSIEGGDFLSGQANSAIFNPETGEFFIPGQKPPDPNDPDEADEEKDSDENVGEGGSDAAGGDGDAEGEPTEAPIPAKPAKGSKPAKPAAKPAPAKPGKAKARLTALANSLADRILRKEAKGKPDAKFVAEVLNISAEQAESYVATRTEMTEEQARAALVALAMGDENEA